MEISFRSLAFASKIVVAIFVAYALSRNLTSSIKTTKTKEGISTSNFTNASRLSSGHWEYVDRVADTFPPYTYDHNVCMATALHQGDCNKTSNYCRSNLMNWNYIGKDNEPYPRFDVDGFRRKMRNTRIVFIGPSMIRQSVQSLVWALGFKNIAWNTTGKDGCSATRMCVNDVKSNITICYQFMGSMATKIYHEGIYTLNHSLRGFGDSSCLLHDESIAELNEFDVVFVQEVAWWTNLHNLLDSPTSPSEWVQKMVPTMYYDAMKVLLSKISQQTKTVFVLGQTGIPPCVNKTGPELFSIDKLPTKFGWNLAPKLWDTALALIQDEGLNVQVIDAREPLMQSVHAHPSQLSNRDCLHFCLNSAAVNIYIDMYWNEVFSSYHPKHLNSSKTKVENS